MEKTEPKTCPHVYRKMDKAETDKHRAETNSKFTGYPSWKCVNCPKVVEAS